ncbi:MAG: pknB [Glaciihabitans sp.]|nr:pknB [Glaciihabitans sp.]
MTEGVASDVRLLAGRYRVGELIGRGGMADVHEGTDARLGRRVAIKLLKPNLANDPAFRTRFRREAQDAAKMAHPTIVRIFDAGEETVTDLEGNERQLPFIIMEFVDGRLLKDILAEGALPADEAVRIIEQVLSALEYSHRAGVVHRDIKPGNIMVSTTGQVKVMDFGIARAISESSATIAETSAIVGTAQYFSPEQARGETVDARTDLYSAGVVLFELLTGVAPFRGTNPVAVAYQHVNQNPAPPSTLNPKVSPALDVVVLRALSKDRFARFQSAGEFREHVEAAARGDVSPRPIPSKDSSTSLFGVNPDAVASSEATLRQLNIDEDARVTRPQSRPPVAWIAAGILVMVVVIVAVLSWTINLPQTGSITSALSVSVPKVSGQTYDVASESLVADDLVPRQYSETSATVPAGQIIRTVPEAGSEVSRQQLVRVYVSTGAATVSVPEIAGQTLEAAQAAITARNLVVGAVTRQDSPAVPADVVVDASPAALTAVPEGSTVDIIVSTGAVTVPNVVGASASDAGKQLAALELNVSVTANYGCTGRAVTSQSLTPGTYPQGTAISIDVCSG